MVVSFGVSVSFGHTSLLKSLKLKSPTRVVGRRSLHRVKAADIHKSASGEAVHNPVSPEERRRVNLVLGAGFDIYLVQISDWLKPKHSAVTIRG